MRRQTRDGAKLAKGINSEQLIKCSREFFTKQALAARVKQRYESWKIRIEVRPDERVEDIVDRFTIAGFRRGERRMATERRDYEHHNELPTTHG